MSSANEGIEKKANKTKQICFIVSIPYVPVTKLVKVPDLVVQSQSVL
jgi:hypothetical protein